MMMLMLAVLDLIFGQLSGFGLFREKAILWIAN
jgi:hypothetical protein